MDNELVHANQRIQTSEVKFVLILILMDNELVLLRMSIIGLIK